MFQNLMYGAYILLAVDYWIPVTPPRNVELALLIHAIKPIVAGFVQIEKKSGFFYVSLQSCSESNAVEVRASDVVEISSVTRVSLEFLKSVEQLFDVIANCYVAVDQILVQVREDSRRDSSIRGEIEENCTATEKWLIVSFK